MKTLRDPTIEIRKLTQPRKQVPGMRTQRLRIKERERESPSKRGYGRRWRRMRDIVLSREPLCRACSTRERPVAATEVDHIVPHRKNQMLLYDFSNLQPLCKACHARKTAAGL